MPPIRFTALAIAPLVIPVAAHADTELGLVSIPELSGIVTQPSAITDDGSVAGSYRPFGGSSAFRGFESRASGAFNTLEPIQDSTETNLQNAEAFVTALLPDGTAIGYSDTRWGITQNAAIWNTPASPTSPFGGVESSFGGVSEGVASFIWGANNNGDYVGGRELTGGGTLTPFVWAAGAADPQFLSLPAGATSADARGISDSGHVVVQATVPGAGFAGFFYENAGSPAVDMGSLGGPGTRPAAVNDAGEVVGTALNPSSSSRAFYWDAVNGIREAPVFGSLRYSLLLDINNAGDAVGYSRRTGSGQRDFAYVLNVRTGTLMFLDFLLPLDLRNQWELREALAINDRGQIVGTGRFNGSVETFVLQLPGYPDGPEPCNAADLADPVGVLDLADITAFVAAFTAQDPVADLDGNALFDLADITAFVTAFTAGCP
jgi:uncharacterized membrane protein